VARAGSGLDEPPYGGFALSRVAGLPPPEPARLARQVRRREGLLFRTAHGLRKSAPGPVLGAVLLAFLAGAGWLAWQWWSDRPERLMGEGRYQEALALIEARAAREGRDAPEVLYLRGRLEKTKAEAEAGGSVELAYQLWAKALARRSPDALAALAAEARSPACPRQLLAARALADSGTELARPVLEDLARKEPPAGLSGGFVPGLERCGYGDVAREGLEALRARKGK
jgi:hypothetical protein